MIKTAKLRQNAQNDIGANRNFLNLSANIPMQVRILRELPQTFPEIMEYLRVDLFNLTVREMAEKIGTSVKCRQPSEPDNKDIFPGHSRT